MAKKLFVSIAGNDTNPGTYAHPFRHIQTGIDALEGPDDVVTVRGGVYVESVDVNGKEGAKDHVILIQAHRSERVVIDVGYQDDDAAAKLLREAPNQEWVPADPATGGPDEYVSARSFTVRKDDPLNKGAFIDLPRYTRLITYSTLQDLRASNQTFGDLLEDDGPPGPLVVDADTGDPIWINLQTGEPRKGETQPSDRRAKRPWVYMGPGIFHSDDGKIHIRLSHTRNNIGGFADYNGETNPNHVGFAISRQSSATLRVTGCRFVTFRNLTFRFGGETARVHLCQDVLFDHVRFFAGGKAVEMGHDGQNGSERTTFSNCEFQGGLPTWYFRSDRKDGYWFRDGNKQVLNSLGAGTSSVLLAGSSGPLGSADTVVQNCEFVHGHDLQLFGKRFRFHHNWIHNLQDEALILDRGDTSGEVSQNVITQCLTAISVAGQQLGGLRVIHHNLIDLRSPTAGIRPQPVEVVGGQQAELRYGQFYGSNGVDGPIDLLYNTCLVRHQQGGASFQHYGNTKNGGPRRSFNNIFVDIDPVPLTEYRGTSFLPRLPDFVGPTDGNCYFQVGEFFHQGDSKRTGILWHPGFEIGNKTIRRTTYQNLAALRGNPPGTRASPYFQHSKAVYPPGYERNSIDVDPLFMHFDPAGPRRSDDFRLRSHSPARKAGVALSVLRLPIPNPQAPSQERPDMGCYGGPGAEVRMRVGVDGRKQFPEALGLDVS